MIRLDSEIFEQIGGGAFIYYTSDGGRRQTPRAQVRLKATLLRHGTESQVEINDISCMGAGLTCPTPVLVGEHLTIRFDVGDGQAVSLICAARHCVKEEDEFQVGVEYLRLIEQPSAAGRQTT